MVSNRPKHARPTTSQLLNLSALRDRLLLWESFEQVSIAAADVIDPFAS
jgi:hypothetical protein